MRIVPAQHMKDTVLVHVDKDELDCGYKLLPYATCIGSINTRTGKVTVWTPAGYKPRGYKRAAEMKLEDAYRDILWQRRIDNVVREYVVDGYRAVLNEEDKPRFPNDPHFSFEWRIFDETGTLVGYMFDGAAYGWGRPHCSLGRLVMSGPFPPGVSDPKSKHYGMCFDIGPRESHEKALQAFANAANRLKAWRAEPRSDD